MATSDHTSPASIPNLPDVTTDVLKVSDVLGEITRELVIQDVKLGDQNHPDGTGGPVMQSEAERYRSIGAWMRENGGIDWRHILLQKVYETVAEEDLAKLRAELLQVTATAVQWVLAIDRRQGGESR